MAEKSVFCRPPLPMCGAAKSPSRIVVPGASSDHVQIDVPLGAVPLYRCALPTTLPPLASSGAFAWMPADDVWAASIRPIRTVDPVDGDHAHAEVPTSAGPLYREDVPYARCEP